MEKYDIAIIGSGVAGTFAALRAAETHKAKVILFELGHKPAKRRRQIEGFLGCFPTGDGKIYTNSIDQVLEQVDTKRANAANKFVFKQLEEVTNLKVIKDKMPNVSVQKRIESANFNISLNDYIQWKPESIHQLSKNIVEKIEGSKVLTQSFDNEVSKITKQKNGFIISNQEGDIFLAKISPS